MTTGPRSSSVLRAIMLWLLGVAAAYALSRAVPIDPQLVAASGISEQSLRLLSVLNNAFFLAVAVLVGGLAAHRAGLRSLIGQTGGAWTGCGRAAVIAAVIGIGLGFVVFVVDWVLFQIVPALSELMEGELAIMREGGLALTSRLLYGGLTEEILIRWGLMSGLAWALLKFIPDRETALWTAVGLAAMIFGIGHLPALYQLLGDVPNLLVLRTIGFNLLAGLVYGYLYWQHNLETAMIAHATTHVGMAAAQRMII